MGTINWKLVIRIVAAAAAIFVGVSEMGDWAVEDKPNDSLEKRLSYIEGQVNVIVETHKPKE
jgi:hypothetical protein